MAIPIPTDPSAGDGFPAGAEQAPDVAQQDMVVIQLPKAFLDELVQVLDAAKQQAEADIQTQKQPEGGMNESDQLASEISDMSKFRR